MYSSLVHDLCPDCQKLDEDDFKKVRDFVKENPKVSVEVVVEATGVDEEKVREYVRQGRLDVASFEGKVIECRKCGKPIESGDYCVLCMNSISNTFRNPEGSKDDKDKKKGRIEIRPILPKSRVALA